MLQLNAMKKHFIPSSALFVLFVSLFFAGPTSAHAEFSSIPNSGTLGTDGTVTAVIATSSGIYIGGTFSNVGTAIGGTVSVATSTGAILSYPSVNGTVYAIVSDRSGGWYIGGTINQVGSVVRNDVVHILSNNTVDPNFDPNFSGSIPGVFALALSPDGSTLYVGGQFSTVNGVTYNNLVAINTSNGTASTTFNPNMNNPVVALALSSDGSTLYAGGNFTTVGGVAYNFLAAVNASNGVASTTFNPNMNNSVSALVLSSNGSMLYAGGSFSTVAGVTYNYLAAINASNGAASTTFNPNVGSPINALALSPDNSTLYIGGNFSTVGGVTYNHLAAINTSNGAASTTFNPNVNGQISALALSSDGTILYTGGSFTTVGGVTYNRLAAINTSTASATPAFNPNMTNTVNALALSSDGSQLYLGGNSFLINMIPRNNLAHILSNNTVDSAFNPNMNGQVGALTLSSDGSTLYAGGSFTTVGGVAYNRLAAINTSNGAASTTFNPNVNNAIKALTLSSDGALLYTGGSFTTVGGVTYNHLAAINTSTASATPAFNPNVNNIVSALALSSDGTLLYTGGSFTTVGGVTYNRLAAINTSTASATPAFNPNANSIISALALSSDGSTLYAGGNFTTVGGVTYNHLAAINTSTASATPSFSFNLNNSANTLVLSANNSTLYAGGSFSFTTGGVTYSRLMAIDTFTASAKPAFNPAIGAVSALALSPDSSTLYAGGSFGNVNNFVYNNLALFSYINPPTVTTSVPTSVTSSSFTLNGSITNGGGASSTIRGFVYGLSNAYGATTTESGTFNPGAFGANVSSLACNTVYHYAAYAVNSAGTSTYPADATVTTGACPVIAPPASGGSPGGTSAQSQINNLINMGFYGQAQQVAKQNGISILATPVVPGCPAGYICTPIAAPQSPVKAMASTSSPVFTETLKLGATSTQVKQLQIFLNKHGFAVAPSGAGSPGHETSYFGPATKAALMKFQEAHKEEILYPEGLTSPTGYFGASTMKVANALENFLDSV